MSHVLVVCSPHAGSACPPARIVEALRAAGIAEVDTIAVGDLGMEPRGSAWYAAGFDTVVAAGGDGTVGAVATHIADTPIHLGILALGTANDTARSLGIPVGLDAGVATIAAGHTALIDAGEVLASDGRRARFLHAATIGLNAEFARLATDVERRARLGPLNYPAAALQALFLTRSRSMTLRFPDGHLIDGPALQLAAMNTANVGGAIGLTVPEVDLHDGHLTLLVFRDWMTIERVETPSVVVMTAEPDQVTVDGELLFETPVTLRAARQRVAVLVPEEARATLAPTCAAP